MHESALASSVAQAIRERALSGVPIRLVVSGGHSDAHAFDAALRLHLAAGAPEIDLEAMTIEHLAEERPCLWCSRTFAAVGSPADCPWCGGVGLTPPRPEHVEIIWTDSAPGTAGDGVRVGQGID